MFTEARFNNDDAARDHLETLRWPNGPVCPHCGGVERNSRLYGKAHRPGVIFCGDCRTQFTVTVGTVFERSHIPLHKWLLANHLINASKKGMSAHQLHRMLGVTYKTAWFMAHRIREAMKTIPTGQLGGSGKIVEADETYFGTESDKAKKTLRGNFGKRATGGAAMKQMNKIVSLVERDGQVRSFHVADVTGDNLKGVLYAQIHKDSHVITDSSPRYNVVKRNPKFAKYEQVNHSRGEYVRGIAHTNTVEGYFSLLKRGLIGTYHHVASAHLHRYTNEFDFRYNHRARLGYDDHARSNAILKEIAGKRLTYRRVNAASQAA
jgi:transposase-like protein